MPTPEELPKEHPIHDERARKRALMTVAFTLFLDLMGFGIILPILPFYAESMDATETMVALLSTAFSAAQFVMAPVLGRISDRRGRRPVMLVSIAGSVVAATILGFAHALWLVFVARLVAGASKANVSTAHAYVADLVEPEERARYMGLMGAAMGMGFVFGPGIGGLLGHIFTELPFFVSAGLSLLNLIMAAVWLPETRFIKRDTGEAASEPDPATSVVASRMSPKGIVMIFRSIRGTHMLWLVAIVFCFYVAFAGMESTMALFGERILNWGYRETGLFMTYIGVNMVFFQGFVVGRAVKRIGESGTLAVGLAMSGTALILIGSLDHIATWLALELVTSEGVASPIALVFYAIGGILLAGGNGLSVATTSALVSRVSSPEQQGWNMGIKESASSLARVTGPTVAGPLFQHVHPGAPMLLGGLVALLNVKIALTLRKRMRRDGLQ